MIGKICYAGLEFGSVMPIFEYQCQSCGGEFELLVASSSAKASCPECSSSRVKKRFSLFAVAGPSRASGAAADALRGYGGTSAASCGGCRRRSCSSCR